MDKVLCLIGILAFAQTDPGSEAARPQGVPLIVVAPQAYRQPLTPWLEHRAEQGYRLELIDPGALPSGQPVEVVAEWLKWEIRRQLEPALTLPSGSCETSGPLGFVLLVGDAPGPGERFDPSRLVPGAMRAEKAYPRRGRKFVTDNVFSLPDVRGIPRLAVGRWPVRTRTEVADQVRKALAYERARRPDPDRGCVTFLATPPNYNPVLDPVLEQLAMALVDSRVGPKWRLRALYGSPRSEYFPGPRQAARTVIRWLEEPTPLTLFTGHGRPSSVDVIRYQGRSYPMMDVRLASQIHARRPGTVLWLSACSCGDFDLPPPERCLAEALVMNRAGPVAVVAGSDETSAYANLLHCLGLAQAVLERPPETLGDAFLRFKRAGYQPGPWVWEMLLLALENPQRPEALPEDHQYLYNLLGDPTLPLSLPQKVRFSAEVREEPTVAPEQKRFRIEGRVGGWNGGTACVTFVMDRIALKEDSADPATQADPLARELAYAARFRIANDKVVAGARTELRQGRFELSLSVPERLASQVRWLRLYVFTEPTAKGRWSDGVAAQAVDLAPRARARSSPAQEALSAKRLAR